MENIKLKPITIYRREANLIRADKLPIGFDEEAYKRYTFSFYDEKKCLRCELYEQRHSEPCDSCENYKGTRQLAKPVEINGNSYISIPQGGLKRIENLLNDFNLTPTYVDKYSETEAFSRPIKMLRKPREWQFEACEAVLLRKRGIIQAPPRSGKTVLGVLVSRRIQKKTLIIASQRDWLIQFQKTYLGDEQEEAFTNMSSKRIGFCKTLEDFESKDVCLATFQQFMNDSGKRVLAQISSLFSVVIIDEVHFTAALATSRVVTKFSSEYLIGLTGTPDRKNSSENVIFKTLIGPVIYKAKVEMLRPEIALLRTGVEINMPKGIQSMAVFPRFINKLEVEKTRVKIIAKYVAAAVKKGYTVMLPVQRVKSILVYEKAINSLFEDPVVVVFYGGVKKTGKIDARTEVLRKMKTGEARVIVGNLALLSTGLNIPRLSMLIDRVTITSNIPKTIQRVSRILTPFEDKPQPKLVIVMDDCGMQMSTARNEYFNAIKPNFNPIISEADEKELKQWFSKSKRPQAMSLEG
jgi:superfamily II DNA or RNA helicase